MRKDAQERRDRLIAAAADLFELQCYDVPLEAIAERAGIGRGTLYRNFRARMLLYSQKHPGPPVIRQRSNRTPGVRSKAMSTLLLIKPSLNWAKEWKHIRL